jgi:hypothetical protein
MLTADFSRKAEHTMKIQAAALVLSATVMFAWTSVRAETMRCGQSLVNEQTSVAELLRKCGEPQEKSSSTEDVLAVNAAGHAYKTGETVTRERWVYRRSPGSLPMAVTIENGVIKRIERVR